MPERGATERQRVIGEVESGTSGGVRVLTGILRTGEVSGVPIVKKLVGQIGGTGDSRCSSTARPAAPVL
jgi:MinD superfamily P-loop ATPase